MARRRRTEPWEDRSSAGRRAVEADAGEWNGSHVANAGAGQWVTVFIGMAVTILLMIGALWGWRQGTEFVQFLDTARPDVSLMAVRCAALALGALAQAVLLTFVVGIIYRHDRVTDMLRLLAAVLFLLSISAAVALGVVSR